MQDWGQLTSVYFGFVFPEERIMNPHKNVADPINNLSVLLGQSLGPQPNPSWGPSKKGPAMAESKLAAADPWYGNRGFSTHKPVTEHVRPQRQML